MNDKNKNILLWVIAVVLTIGLVFYQRMTGPTYPVHGKVTINNKVLKYKLIRTHGGDNDAKVIIETNDESITGSITQKRYKSYDEWSTTQLVREDGALVGIIPHQPPAGKVEYKITLASNGKTYLLNSKPVVIRFKGAVPLAVLSPHIFFMFFSMLFALRTGLELFFRKKDTKYYVGVVLGTLFFGGLILGPIVQKFAFGEYWTGIPYGHDLTDNKTLIVFIFWIIAYFVLRKKPANKLWPALAVVVMILVYSIPHSVLGSEIDHTKNAKKPHKIVNTK